jgi:hypothetical protein
MYCLSQTSYTHRCREPLRCRLDSVDSNDCIASTLKQGAEGAIDTRFGSAIRVRLVEGCNVLWRIHEECDRGLLCLSLRPYPLTPMFPSSHFLLHWTSFSRAPSERADVQYLMTASVSLPPVSIVLMVLFWSDFILPCIWPFARPRNTSAAAEPPPNQRQSPRRERHRRVS